MSYAEDAATALEMIAEAGGPITVRATRQAALIPGTDRTSAPPTKLTATPKAVVLPVAAKHVGSDVFGKGTLITQNDRMAYVAGSALAWAPLAGDVVDAGGVSWNVIGTKTLQPDVTGPVLLYTIFFRA